MAGEDMHLTQPLLSDPEAVPPSAVPHVEANGFPTASFHPDGKDGSEIQSVPHDTFWPCTLNLIKVVLGATLLSLPKALDYLGVWTAAAVYLFVYLIMVLTCKALTDAHDETGQRTYGKAVGTLFGKGWKLLLYVCVFLNCFGNMVAYVVLIGDILVGTPPDYNGIVQDLLQIKGYVFWLNRSIVLSVFTMFALIPLASISDMDYLTPMNTIGNGAVVIFAASLGLLTGLSWHKGSAQPLRWTPDWDQLGGDPFSFVVITNLIAVVPIFVNALVCHPSLFPAMKTLKPYTSPRMLGSASTAMGFCTILFFFISICGCLVFGSNVDADVLNNMNVAALAPLMGHISAHILACTVRLCYLAALVGCYGLFMFPMRDSLESQLSDEAAERWFYPISWGLAVIVLVVAVSLSGVWTVLMLSGATTCTVVSFGFPGAMMVRQAWINKRTVGSVLTGLMGVVVLLLGLVMLVVGVWKTFSG